MKISFIVPAYNEEDNIGRVIEELKKTFRDFEIIVVDDFSADKTFQIAKNLCPDTTFKHLQNKGYGAALKTGILNASGDFVIFVDGDGQHPAEEIGKIVEAINGNPELDSVLTRRRNIYISGAMRSIGKVLINYVVRRLTGESIRDSNSGLRAFRRKRILPFLFMLPNGFSFSTTSTVLSYKEDFSIRWIEIEMGQRKLGKSQVKIKHGFNTLLLVIRLIVIFDPLKFFLPVTGYSFLLGIISIVNSFIQTRTIGKNYIFFFLFGMLTFILGLLSEQISTLRKEMISIKTKND
jgi:glycosyltransferase involved in cell wall biosynthesis